MLRQLKLRKQIELKKKEEEEVRAKKLELEKREAQLEVALEECETAEDMAIVEEDVAKLETEKKENDEKKATIEKEIADLEKELKETEEKEKEEMEKNKETLKKEEEENKDEERKNQKYENERGKREMRKSKFVDPMTRNERREYVKREKVKKFLDNIRTVVQQRSINNVDLTIPTETLEIIMDNIGNYSVMYNLVNLRPVGGRARQNIVSEAIEGIWTEMIGTLNELDYGLSQIEVDGYKVGGFTALANSILEDSDEDLSRLVEDLLSESIAIAVDKAVIYGKGKDSKMPLGYVTDLKNDTEYKDTNIIKLSEADTKLAKIIAALGNVDEGENSNGEITVVLNRKTWLKTILPLALSTNQAGAYVSATQNVFPGTGYHVEFCNRIPENNLHAGNYEKYLLAERKGKSVKSSAEAEFVKDITLFKATARYDGTPTRKQAFVVIGLHNTTPTTEVTFAPDKANTKDETSTTPTTPTTDPSKPTE